MEEIDSLKMGELDSLRNELRIQEALISEDKYKELSLARQLRNLKICKEKEKVKICKEICNRLLAEKRKEYDINEIDRDCFLDIIKNCDDDMIRLAMAEHLGVAIGYVHVGANFEIMDYEQYLKTSYAKEMKLLRFSNWVEIVGDNYRIPLSRLWQARDELIRQFSDENQKRRLGVLEIEISDLIEMSEKAREKIEVIKTKLRVGELLPSTQKREEFVSFKQIF